MARVKSGRLEEGFMEDAIEKLWVGGGEEEILVRDQPLFTNITLSETLRSFHFSRSFVRSFVALSL